MAVPLFRTSLLRCTQFLNGTLRNVSRKLGTVNGNLVVRAPIVLPSHPELIRSRYLTTTSAATATATQTASGKKTTSGKRRTVAKKKKPTTKKAIKKKTTASEKKLAAKKKLAARKKIAKAKAKAKAKEPKSTLACSFPCQTLTACL